MRIAVVGLGIQGQKRRRVAGVEAVVTVDPAVADADYRDLKDVPLDAYDAAMLCVPDDAKLEALGYLLSHGKRVLVEKPLLAGDEAELVGLADLARARGVLWYTAYNHRFEPHIERLRETVRSGRLGTIYRARFFYGNGTARDVRNSPWRDRGGGVLLDLVPHLLDMVRFVIDEPPRHFRLWAAHRFENEAPDHAVCAALGPPLIELEASLVSWRNQFSAELYGSGGSAHIDSLCKWGPSTFTERRRVLPSGRPDEDSDVLEQPDPTWAREYDHFKTLCAVGGPLDIENDLWINRVLGELTRAAVRGGST